MIRTEYKIDATTAMKIAVVADLHDNDYKEVISYLQDIRPDIITIPGDLFERYMHGFQIPRENRSFISWMRIVLMDLTIGLLENGRRRKPPTPELYETYFQELVSIAPVFMSLGNHELRITEEDRNLLKKTGIQLLEDDVVDCGDVIFGGVSSKMITGELNHKFLEEFSQMDGYKVLLCHHPEYFEEIDQHPIDLVISGHCHGGQIRIGGKGLLAPGQGFFPVYHHGLYYGNNSKMIVSAGCSNTSVIPRLGNPEEIVIIELNQK